ncbi:hypothetical protein AM1_2138 [Acaryochloris marina MBIC11017]|uniref:Transposase n=1 Tax=Acaryochloris marina (strain MBIC 11017) TaxID=329726 RepID=B0BZU3_ACAM1|nr:hypothetical protein AM1_2138 [Acaryochloris marina MBIC11017]
MISCERLGRSENGSNLRLHQMLDQLRESLKLGSGRGKRLQ